MALNLPSLRAFVAPPPLSSPRPAATPRGRVAISAGPQNTSGGRWKSGRRIWRRRKLTKRDKDEKIGQYCNERVLFLEEQMHKMMKTNAVINADVDLLMLSEENKYAYAAAVAAEAAAYVEANPDEYGTKNPVLHVLSNRMNDMGIYRPEAYIETVETEHFKPGPGYRIE